MPLNRDLFIGFDGGGTKTQCMIGDSSGTIIASTEGASTNLKSRPQEKVREVIHSLIGEIMLLASADLHQVKSVFVSTAGGDREEDRDRWKQWILEYGLIPEQLDVANDAVGALTAGTKSKYGIVLIAGTGSIAYSVKETNEKPVRFGGWGYLLGDEGSGYDIGNQALRMIIRAYDSKNREKELFTRYILEQLGLESPEQLITYIYENPYPRKLIASVAKHVIFLAEQEEQNARGIIKQSINELIDLVFAIIKTDKDSRSIVISGGLFYSTYFKEVFEHSIQERGCNLAIITPKYPPVVGSYMRALLQNGKTITDEVERNIDNSWRQINE